MDKTLITHDRVCHADDVFASATLNIVFPGIQIIRTRDPATLRNGAEDPNTFLLDVGGQYDAERLLFDHHQPEGAGFRNPDDKEWPFATAGLVWKHFGREALGKLHPKLTEGDISEVHRYIDEALMKFIDAVDCGIPLRNSGPSLSAIIGSFNTSWYRKDEDVFPLVMELAQVVLTNFINRYVGKILARSHVRTAKTSHSGRILVLDECCPWSEIVAHEMPQVQLVLYPVETSWQLRVAQNGDASPRIRMPQSWAGLDRAHLAAVCGVDSALFCHRSRHLAGAESLCGALCMAERVMNETHALAAA